MVIRRIRQHVETHNWFAVFIDLVIVVAGVFGWLFSPPTASDVRGVGAPAT